ncbi:hypothetical protein BS50DRAFT_586494 [Corynespora cassiicola Philippines]|uniref:Stc1 domain-containing protein n=1 Tax=Corynespora cassiicola Philippines TaxID=1448308 RepID=A0A2T2NUS3_CORCC|nr:hypothetical protein BS50DRAFT_586494 [Corynespora cassiicola Philippines]
MSLRSRKKHAFNPAEMKELESVQLPPRLKCVTCNKHKSHQNYSNRMISEARYGIKNRHAWSVNCIPCAGNGQLMEMECIVCHETKGLDDFAKVQRKKPDSAKCFACMDKQLELNPVEEDRYDDPREAFIDDADTYGKYPEYWPTTATDSSVQEGSYQDHESDDDEFGGGISLAQGFAGISLGSSQVGTLIDTDDGDSRAPEKLADDGWSTVPSSKKAKSSISAGFDPYKYGHPSSSVHSFNSGKADRSDINSNKGGWVKIKSYKTESAARDSAVTSTAGSTGRSAPVSASAHTPTPTPTLKPVPAKAQDDVWKSDSEEDNDESDDDEDEDNDDDDTQI